jgi:hypothetical protein
MFSTVVVIIKRNLYVGVLFLILFLFMIAISYSWFEITYVKGKSDSFFFK